MDAEERQLLTELRAELAEMRTERRRAPAHSLTVAELYALYAKSACHKHSWRMEEDKLSPTVRLLGVLFPPPNSPPSAGRSTARSAGPSRYQKGAGTPASRAQRPP